MAGKPKGALIKSLVTAARIAAKPGGPSLATRGAALPRLVKATIKGDYKGITMGRLALMLAAAGYIASPVDLLPEGLLGPIGLTDDAMVLSWLAAQLVTETENFLAWERGEAPAPTAQGDATGMPRPSGASGQTVPGRVVR